MRRGTKNPKSEVGEKLGLLVYKFKLWVGAILEGPSTNMWWYFVSYHAHNTGFWSLTPSYFGTWTLWVQLFRPGYLRHGISRRRRG